MDPDPWMQFLLAALVGMVILWFAQWSRGSGRILHRHGCVSRDGSPLRFHLILTLLYLVGGFLLFVGLIGALLTHIFAELGFEELFEGS